MQLKPGLRLRSAACDTQAVVVRSAGDGLLACGGAEMVPIDAGDPAVALDPTLADGTLMGKRYTNAAGTIEVLCVNAGAGSLTLDGERLEIKSAKALPASD